MVMRFFLVTGLILLGGTAYFVVGQQPPTYQATPMTGEVTILQAEGVLPSGDIAENEEVEHSVFRVPEEDEAQLAAAMANMDMNMDMDMDMNDGESMNMEMNMEDGETMNMEADGAMNIAEDDTMNMETDGTMNMAEDGTMNMEADGAMNMAEDDTMNMETDGTMNMAEDGTMNMEADGAMNMAEDDTMNMETEGDTMAMAEEDADHAEDRDAGEEDGDHAADAGADPEHGGEDEEEEERLMAGRMAGLIIRNDGAFDREITLSMSEWTFSDLEIDAKAGERIRFTLRNDGTILHEFMFMSMAAMQAVNYRARRADWNLLEHEALYEKSLLLPGQEITFVAQVTKPGAWMFMCMLPYHMQMGMMGQMATEGMAMEMEM